MRKNLATLITTALLVVCMLFAGCAQPAANPSEPAAGTTEVPAAVEPAAKESATEEPTADKDYTVGIFVKDNSNPFWRYVVNGAMTEGEAQGIKVVEYSPAEAANVEQQTSLIEDAVSSGIDAICVVAIDAEAVKPALQKALDAGIVVVPFNSRINDMDLPCFVGVDNYTGQCNVAEQIFKDFDYEADIVILEGLVSGYANIERLRAIKDVAAKYEGINILTSQVTNGRREEAMTVMENVLQTYDHIDIVFGHNDNVALGSAQAIKDVGREDEITVVGFDGTLEGIEAVRDGAGLTYSLDQSPFQQGAYSVRAAVTLLDGGTVEKEIPTGGTLITKGTAQGIIDEFYTTK